LDALNLNQWRVD